jgi:hypothetical protein
VHRTPLSRMASDHLPIVATLDMGSAAKVEMRERRRKTA